MTSYDFDFLTDSKEANKQAILLAKIRYNEQLAPFISSPNASDQEARLRYASDHIERIIDECCEVTNAEREVVSSRFKQIIAKEVATTQPQKRNVTEQVTGVSDDPGNAVEQDILDRDAVLESEILDPDAQIEADTPLSEGEKQYPKAAARKTADDEDWDTDEVSRWFDNDETLYDAANEAAQRAHSNSDLAEEMRAIWNQVIPPANVDEDQVDWEYVAGSFATVGKVKIACVRCDGECDGEGPVCTECGNFLAKRADYSYGQQAPVGQVPMQGQPVTQAPQQPQNNQQMKCDVCGFVGNAQQVQDHYQKMVAANDQLHMNNQPAGNPNVQPGQVQASTVESAYHYIRKEGDQYCIWQKSTGKTLSCHDSKEKAEAAFRGMMASKHGADESFLDQGHNHDQEDRAEGNPVREDYKDKDESQDPSDRLDATVQDIADHAAASRYSQATDDEVRQIADRYGISPEQVKQHLHIVALFGDYTGLNGELVKADPDTSGLTEINDQDLGGQTESHEALVPLDKAVNEVAKGLGLQVQDAYDRIQEGFGGEDLPDEYHASVEGQRNFYLPSQLVSSGTPEGADQAQPQQPQQNTGQPQQ